MLNSYSLSSYKVDYIIYAHRFGCRINRHPTPFWDSRYTLHIAI